MIKCSNRNCENDADGSLYSQIVSIDGDMVCCQECKDQYEQQKAKFFNEIVHDPKKTEDFLLGK